MSIMRKHTVMRINVNWLVDMESLNKKQTISNVKVLTFSSGGLSFKCKEEIKVGESFIIHLPFASVPISVVRCLDDRYGALFLNISLEEIDLIKQHLYKEDGQSILLESISQF